MALYKLDEAIFLIDYYTPILVGNILESSTASVITRLDKELYNGNLYRVNAYGTVVRGIFWPKRSIKLVIRDLGAISLREAIRSKSQVTTRTGYHERCIANAILKGNFTG